MDDNDWDLFAVVRGCAAVAPPDVSPPPEVKAETRAAEGKGDAWWFPDASAAAAGRYEQLEELCKQPFYAKPCRPAPPLLMAKTSYPSSATAVFPVVPYGFQQLQPRLTTAHRPVSSQTPRSKRRKNQQKKVVCQVPADGVSSDMWAWRKYGQKPIKGSPYPRGYYRCSSSKGCQARKQVERSRADPGMLVITYTAEHNHPVPTHRNSLSGSTRQKLPPLPQPSPADSLQLPSSSPTAAPRLSPTREKGDVEEEEEEDLDEVAAEECEEEEDALTVGDVEMMGEEEMLFLGMEVIDTSPASASAGVEKSPATVSVSAAFFEEDAGFEEDDFFPSPWFAKSNPTAAAGGR